MIRDIFLTKLKLLITLTFNKNFERKDESRTWSVSKLWEFYIEFISSIISNYLPRMISFHLTPFFRSPFTDLGGALVKAQHYDKCRELKMKMPGSVRSCKGKESLFLCHQRFSWMFFATQTTSVQINVKKLDRNLRICSEQVALWVD
jgi:hypothetical protein